MLEDGMRIVATGSISFTKETECAVGGTGAMMDGIGAWYSAFKRLEARFFWRGLPESDPIPAARRIGVATSLPVFHIYRSFSKGS